MVIISAKLSGGGVGEVHFFPVKSLKRYRRKNTIDMRIWYKNKGLPVIPITTKVARNKAFILIL